MLSLGILLGIVERSQPMLWAICVHARTIGGSRESGSSRASPDFCEIIDCNSAGNANRALATLTSRRICRANDVSITETPRRVSSVAHRLLARANVAFAGNADPQAASVEPIPTHSATSNGEPTGKLSTFENGIRIASASVTGTISTPGARPTSTAPGKTMPIL